LSIKFELEIKLVREVMGQCFIN